MTIVTRLHFIAAGSKAICFSKRTLDIWNRFGVAKPMVEKGVIWNVGKVFRGADTNPIYQFDMLPVKDQQMPGFGRVNGSIGYRFSDIGPIKAPEIKLTLSNLLNSRQLTGISSVTSNANATVGVRGSTIAGSTPYYYQGEGFSALVTARAAF